MKRAALQQAVEAFKQRIQFEPFVVEMDDGRQLVVDKPERLTCFGGAATYLPEDDFVFLEAEDVTRIVDGRGKVYA